MGRRNTGVHQGSTKFLNDGDKKLQTEPRNVPELHGRIRKQDTSRDQHRVKQHDDTETAESTE